MRLTTQTRLTVTATGATLLTTLTLAPVLKGALWYVGVVLMVTVLASVGMLARRLTRSWLLVVMLQAAVYTVTLTVVFARDQAVFGLVPGPTALQRLGTLLGDGLKVARDQAPPVETVTGLQLLVMSGIGLVGLAVDVIAVTLRRSAVAGLPLLAVYCVPASVLPGGLAWYWFALAAAGFLALVGAEAIERIRSWGKVLGGSSTPDDEPGPFGFWPSTGGGRAAMAAVVLAVLIPAILPGLGDPILGGNGSSGKGAGTGAGGRYVNPILDLRRNLTRRSNDVALRYHSDGSNPQPLRIVVDDSFDGRTWSPRRESPPQENRVQDGLPGAPGLSNEVTTSQHRIDVQVADLDQTYLPLPYPTTRVSVQGNWLYDATTLNVLGKDVRTRGLTYSAEYLQVVPTPEQLLAAGTPSAATMTSYTALPEVPDSIRQTAADVAGNGRPYERAVRLQEWFRSSGGFQYSTQAQGQARTTAAWRR